MGGTSSTNEVVSKEKKAKVLGPSALPVQPHYNDTPVEYIFHSTSEVLDKEYISQFRFMEPKVSRKSTIKHSSLTDMFVSDSQYKLLAVVALTGDKVHNVFNTNGIEKQITAQFERIFRKMFPEEAGQIWKLVVEKSMLNDGVFKWNWNANMLLHASSHSENVGKGQPIFQTIAKLAQQGGRLVSVEMTGMGGQEIREHKQLMQSDPIYWAKYKYGEMPPMHIEVDVFFEMPQHTTTERYTYQVVSCPMNSAFQQSSPRGHFVSVIDWQGVMKQYMESGWKLVEILEDYAVSTMTKQHAFAITKDIRNNCLWIFEKPLSRLNDDTAYYEGTMVECQSRTITYEGYDMNLIEFGLIKDMGKYGWQVVRILETPDIDVTEEAFSQMIFFQRKIAGRNEFTGTSAIQYAPLISPPGPSQSGKPDVSAQSPSNNDMYTEK